MDQIAVQICLSFRFCSRKWCLWLFFPPSSIAVEFCLSVLLFLFKSMVLEISWFCSPSPLSLDLLFFPASWSTQALFPEVSPRCGAVFWESTWANQFPQFVNPRLIQPFKSLVPCHCNHLQIALQIQLQSSNRLPIFCQSTHVGNLGVILFSDLLDDPLTFLGFFRYRC